MSTKQAVFCVGAPDSWDTSKYIRKEAEGGVQGKNQLWAERGEEKGRVSQSMVQMAVGYQAF